MRLSPIPRSVVLLGCAWGLSLLTSACNTSAPSAEATAPATPPALAPAASPSGATGTPADEAPPPEQSGPAQDGADSDLSVDISNERYEFQFTYPVQAARIPELRDWFLARRASARSRIASQASQGQKEAAKGNYPYHAYASTTNWQVVTDLPDWLSLSAEIYTFSGGAHGMSGFDALLWDRRTGTPHQAADLFTSREALSSAVQSRMCKALDAERVRRRGAPLVPGDTFSDCIDPLDQTILLGSSNGTTFDRIGFEIAPYEAGPYAEGSYDITLPVDGAVMRALKPQYRSRFSIPD